MPNSTVPQPQRAAAPRKLFLIGALIVLLGAVAWFLTRHTGAKPTGKATETAEKKEEKHDPNLVLLKPEAMKNAGIILAKAETRPLQEMIHATGSVGPNETRVAHLRTIARGRIQKVYVRLGDHVRNGQPLAAYDNIELGELTGQYGVGQAALKRAEAQAEVAKRSLERAKGLVDLGAIAKGELERRSAEYASAVSEINTQRAELAKTEEKLHRFGMTDQQIRAADEKGEGHSHREASQTVLTAPFAGVITAYNVAEGEPVETNQELFTLADLSIVWVQADIFEKDIAAVRKGQTVQIMTDAYPGQTFTGRITYVGDVLDPKTRTAKVRCEVNNADGRLKLEMFATIALPSPVGRSTVMIPAAAIQTVDDKPIAFVRTAADQFRARELTIGVKSGEWIEVKSGVEQGESVATAGSFTLKSLLLRERIGGEE